MKYLKGKAPVTLVTPPIGTLTVIERLMQTHPEEQSAHQQVWARQHDKRPDLASGIALQRLRARMMQPRTAVDSHIRTRRRQPD